MTRMPPLEGRVVIITGASEGIGRALAIELAGARACLVLAARNRARLEELATECAARGAETLVVETDVALREDCTALIGRAIERFGRLDVLVNNAGIAMWSRLDALEDPEVLERLMRVNYLGSAWTTLAALPHLRRDRGLIVAVASVAGFTGLPERTGYAASKHAMMGFFESLRIELYGSGVDVTIVAPDFVVSEIHRRALGRDGQPLKTSPMREAKIMSAADCARLIHRAIARRQRLLITSWRAWLGYRVRPLVPRLIDAIASRAIRRRR